MKASRHIRVSANQAHPLLSQLNNKPKRGFKISRIQHLFDHGNKFEAIMSNLRQQPKPIRPIHSLSKVSSLLQEEVLPQALNGKYKGKGSLTRDEWNDLIMTLASQKKYITGMGLKETDPEHKEFNEIMVTASNHLKIIEDYFFRFPDEIPT